MVVAAVVVVERSEGSDQDGSLFGAQAPFDQNSGFSSASRSDHAYGAILRIEQLTQCAPLKHMER